MAINQIISSCRFWIRKQLTKVGWEKVLVSSKCCGQLLMVWGSKLMLHHSNARSLLSLKGWLGTKMFLLWFCQRGSSNGWWKRVYCSSASQWHMLLRTQEDSFIAFKGTSDEQISRQLAINPPNEFPVSVKYSCQARAWVHQAVLLNWIEQVWKPWTQGFLGETTYLLIDDFSGGPQSWQLCRCQ